MTILEIHGIANAEKAMMSTSKLQRVTVTDDVGKVLLCLSDPPTAGLTPAQAKLVAKQLIESADRVEKTRQASPPAKR